MLINQDKKLTILQKKFTDVASKYIQAKVDEYNLANGTVFESIHNCESYSRAIGYTHQAFCLQAWEWSIDIWETVRAITVLPTDTEFQAILDGVTF